MSTVSTKGVSLVEVVVVAAIFAGAVVALLSLYASQSILLTQSTRELQAALLLEEGIEIIRYRRDIDWATSLGAYTTGGTIYHFDMNTSIDEWQLLAGLDDTLIDDTFDRFVYFNTVNRTASGDITLVGGTPDPDIRLVTVTVEWLENGATTTRTLSTFFTNVFRTS